jgi:hypothetical protein
VEGSLRKRLQRAIYERLVSGYITGSARKCIRPLTCNVMRILRLDVTAIIACNARRMVRSDPSAGGFSLENKGFGLGFELGSQYTFGRLSACMSVWTCVREQGKLKRGMKRDH